MATPEEIRRQALETATIVEDALRNIAGSIQNAFEQAMSGADRVTQATAKDLQANFNKFAKITDDIASNTFKIQQGLLKSKAIQEQINKRRIDELSLGTKLVTNLRQQGVQVADIDELIERQGNGTLRLTRAQKELVKEYIKAKGFNDDYINQLQEQNREVERQEKALGNTGKLIKGISKIPVLGNLIDSEKVLSAVQKEAAKEGSTRTKTMAAGFKAVGSSLKEGFTDPLTIGTFLIKSILNASTKITDIQKSFGVNRETARDISLEFERQSIVSGDIFITSKKLNQSFRELSTELGFAADISGQTLETFTNLTKRLGFGNKEAAQLTYLARLQGENTEETLQNTSKTVSNLNKQRGTAINIKDVFSDIASASAATVVSLGGSVDALAEASVKARQLGLTLGQVDQIAASLLDFQTSIENELAAELMTGKQINLEQARYYALTNQTAKLTEEISNNQEVISAFASDNRLAQEAAAKALGMSRDDLGKMIMQQQFLALGAEAFKAKFGEANYKQMQALSIGERFQSTLEKVQEIIGNIGYALEPVGNLLAWMAESSTVMLTALGALVGLSFARAIGSLTVMAVQAGLIAAGSTAANAAITFGFGTAAVLTALGLLAGAMIDFSKADDMISPGYGKRMLFDEGKIFALNNKDNVIATTNPILANDIVSKPAGSIKTSPNQVINQQSAPPQTINNRIELSVNYDGQKINNIDHTSRNKVTNKGIFPGAYSTSARAGA